MKKLTYHIQTFGCQMNYSDSERIANFLEILGFTESKAKDKANLCIINTCSVRQKAEDKAIGFLTNWKKNNPKNFVGLTGCMIRNTGIPETVKDKIFKNKRIDFIFQIKDLLDLQKILNNFFSQLSENFFSTSFKTCPFPFYQISEETTTIDTNKTKQLIKKSVQKSNNQIQDCETDKNFLNKPKSYFAIPPKIKNKTQVFVPIMTGCNKFCSYCIVPYSRGPEVSRPLDQIFFECENLVKNGAKEITLLGQNVNSYMHENKKNFPLLLKKIDTLHKKGLSRLRFTSSHPQDFSEETLDILFNMKTFCSHIHIPAQHGSDPILKKMNRNYTKKNFLDIVKNIRKKNPNISLTTDIIVGFPGETEKNFEELCDFAKEVEFDFSYTAIFSSRPNTAAAEMKSEFIDYNTKKQRFRIFDNIIKKTAFRRRKKIIGSTLEILVENSVLQKNNKWKNIGRSREFLETEFFSDKNLLHQEVDVKIVGNKNYILQGEL